MTNESDGHDLDDLLVRLRIVWTSCNDRVNRERAEAASEIERLREQRDEARMEVCMIRAWKTDWWNMDDAMRQYAAQRGWEMPKPEPIPEPETEGNDDAGT